jgi:hypothetical protein
MDEILVTYTVEKTIDCSCHASRTPLNRTNLAFRHASLGGLNNFLYMLGNGISVVKSIKNYPEFNTVLLKEQVSSSIPKEKIPKHSGVIEQVWQSSP